MPLVFLLFLGVACGFGVALAARNQLIRSSKAPWREVAFSGYAAFVCMVLLPSALYFYAFHPDWFLLYAIDAASVTMWATALTAIVLVAMPLIAFVIAASWLRGGGAPRVRQATVALLALTALVWPLAWPRLSLVGSSRQYELQYGLTPYLESAAFRAGALFMVVLVAALAVLLYRVRERDGD